VAAEETIKGFLREKKGSEYPTPAAKNPLLGYSGGEGGRRKKDIMVEGTR